MKHIKIMFFAVLFTIISTSASFAYSSNWFQENGQWKIRDGSGNVITNAWLCDDTESSEPWYLLDSNGNIVIGLAQDHESWYFLGSDGRLKTTSGYYDGIYLDISLSGAIKNLDGVMLLAMKRGGCSVTKTNKSIYAGLSSATFSTSQDAFMDLYIPEFESEFDHLTREEYNNRIDEIGPINMQNDQASRKGSGKYLVITAEGVYETFTNSDVIDNNTLQNSDFVAYAQQVLAEFGASNNVQFCPETTGFAYSLTSRTVTFTFPSGVVLWYDYGSFSFSYLYSEEPALVSGYIFATKYNIKKVIYRLLKNTVLLEYNIIYVKNNRKQ